MTTNQTIEQIFGWAGIIAILIGFGWQALKTIIKKKPLNINIFEVSLLIASSFIFLIYGLIASAFHIGLAGGLLTLFSCIFLFYVLKAKMDTPKALFASGLIAIFTFIMLGLLIGNRASKFINVNNGSAVMTIGVIAGFLLAAYLILQLVKFIKHKNTHDLTFIMLIGFAIAQGCFIICSITRISALSQSQWMPGLLFYAFALLLQSFILYIAFYSHKKNKTAAKKLKKKKELLKKKINQQALRKINKKGMNKNIILKW